MNKLLGILSICLFILALAFYSNSCGNGTKALAVLAATCNEDDTLISNRDELEAIINDMSNNYCLVANIDLSSGTWTALGSPASPFLGNFNGDGHTISSLAISSPEVNHIGLFAQLGNTLNTDTEVKNLAISAVNINGANNVGTLTGLSYIQRKTEIHIENMFSTRRR